MKKLGFILLTSLLLPTLYEGRKYYVYAKMVNKYERDNCNMKENLFHKISNLI